MKTQVFGSCGRYIQGYGELDHLKKHVDWMGKRFLFIASKNRIRDLGAQIEAAMDGKDIHFYEFNKQITWEEIKKIEKVGKEFKPDAVVGLGGGKIADTAKVVAYDLDIPVVIIPTIAASDASTSATSLIYFDNGTIDEVVCFPKSPEVVLADTKIIVQAPVRLFVAGMGDALSTYVGGLVCQEHYFDNHFNGVGTESALAIAKLSYDYLFQYGLQAKIAAENKAITDAFNKIVEVNILMSGLGFENNGSASDHCFYFGTLALGERASYVYHGEGVAFSTCCQLVMQGASNEELDRVYRFCIDVGLPVTFEDMHLSQLSDEDYDTMTKGVLKEGFIHHHPFPVTYELIMGAYKTADALGHFYHSGGSLV